MLDQAVSGEFELTGSAGKTPGTSSNQSTFPEWLSTQTADTPVAQPASEVATTWKRLSQWIKPVWMAPWSFVSFVFALVLGSVWAVGESVFQRKRIVAAVQRGGARIRSADYF